MNRTYSHESPSVLDVRDPYSAFYQGPHHGKHWYLWHPDDIGTAMPMNEVEWFKAFQPLLLRVVNSGYGRQLMGIDADLPTIHKVYKNALHCYLGEGKWWAEFRVGAKWANVIRYRWPEFKRYARFFYDMPNFFTMLEMNGKLVPAHATSTFYPDANPESTSVEGYCWDSGGSGWADSRNETTAGSVNDHGTTFFAAYIANNYQILRQYALFDTASLGSGATVSAGVVSIFGKGRDDNDDEKVCLTGGAPASNTAIVGGDYDGYDALNSPTEFITRLDIGSWSTSAYNDMTLNAAGIARIAVADVTKFMFRQSGDVDNAAQASNTNSAYAHSSEVADTTSDPKMVVTHTVPSDTQALNGIALGDIQAVNGITVANAQAFNGITF
jgi:hypothetical protein